MMTTTSSKTRRASGLAVFLCLAATFATLPARAWAPLGHRMVGELAERELTPATRTQVEQLLRGEQEPTLAGVANWADWLRQTDPARFKQTSRWHYVNHKGGDCGYVRERDCPDGACVVEAINAQAAILGDGAKPLAERRDALKFVVHFIGDVHQPLHSSSHDDSGGNQFQVSLTTRLVPEAYAAKDYANGVMGTNLHAMWDYYVLGEAGLRSRDYSARLWMRDGLPLATPKSAPAGWAAESCALVDGWGLYPQSHSLDARYGQQMRPLAERRVEQAGHRLAVLLNSLLDPSYRAPH